MARSVAIVFDPDFASSLGRVAFHTPVWMVDTPENRSAAEEAWRTAIDWPHISVTLFRADHDWPTLLQMIALHHDRLDLVDTIGAPLSPAARSALDSAGFVRIEETPGGFRARR